SSRRLRPAQALRNCCCWEPHSFLRNHCQMIDRFGLLYDESFNDDLGAAHDGLDFLEIIPDRFSAVDDLSQLPEFLRTISAVFHPLNLSLGSDEPLDASYLKRISTLVKHFRPMWVSDHLAVTRIDGIHLGHLSPVRWNAAAVARIAGKIARIQDGLGVP